MKGQVVADELRQGPPVGQVVGAPADERSVADLPTHHLHTRVTPQRDSCGLRHLAGNRALDDAVAVGVGIVEPRHDLVGVARPVEDRVAPAAFAAHERRAAGQSEDRLRPRHLVVRAAAPKVGQGAVFRLVRRCSAARDVDVDQRAVGASRGKVDRN